jgi:Condensation domain
MKNSRQSEVHDPASRPTAGHLPLSFQQEWLWHYLSKHSTRNLILTFAVKLIGELRVDVLEQSFESIMKRHASLRTRIVLVDGQPAQIVDAPREFRLDPVTLANGAEGQDTEHAACDFVEKFFATWLDMSAGPTLQVRLLRLSARSHVLAIAIHHIVSDAFSMVLFFKELWSLYVSHLQGQPASLEAPFQYADYAIWQRDTSQDWHENHEAYWTKRLEGASRVRLPPDAGLTNVRPRTPAPLHIAFDRRLSVALNVLAEREKVALPTLILAIYAACISSWCKQRDFVIGFNVSGRHRPEHANAMGYFPQILFLRIELTGSESFSDLFRIVTQEFLAAWTHLDFARIVAKAPELYHGTFLQWLPWRQTERAGTEAPAEWRERNIPLALEPFSVKRALPDDVQMDGDILLHLLETPEGICAVGYYRADLFSPETMERFARELRVAAERAVRGPRTRAVTSEV